MAGLVGWLIADASPTKRFHGQLPV